MSSIIPLELTNKILEYTYIPYIVVIYTWYMNSGDEDPRYDEVYIFQNYEEAITKFENLKENLYYLAADYIIDINSVSNYSDNDFERLQFIIEKKTDGLFNLTEYEIFQDGNWKRPKGIILKIFDKNEPMKLNMNSKPLHRYFNW